MILAHAIERARQADILETARRFVELKRAGAHEYFGPCPVFGCADRFSVNTRKQVWNCRGCGRGGDVVDLVGVTRRFVQNCTLTGYAERHCLSAGF